MDHKTIDRDIDVAAVKDDVRLIRELMTRYEEQPLVRPWVFVTWGIAVLSGTAGTWLAYINAWMTPHAMIVRIWLPVLVVAGAFELAGWLWQHRRGGPSLLTRERIKLMGAYGGLVAVIVLLGAHVLPDELTPAIVLAVAATPLLVYAQMTFASLFVEAYLLIVLAAIAWLAFGSSPAVVAGAGVISGCVYIVTGIHSGACERSAIRS